MKKLITAAAILSFSACAMADKWAVWDNPIKPFDATATRIHNGPVSVEWRIEDNVSRACDRASREFGNNGFGGRDMQGCAFWWGEKCVIITKKNPTMHTVGHEMRHCFYGEWHPGKGH